MDDIKEFDYCDADSTFYHKVKAFFANDPSIEVGEYDDEEHGFEIYVNDYRKLAILNQALTVPEECDDLNLQIVYSGEERAGVADQDLVYLLNSNPLFSRIMKEDMSEKGPAMSYVLMKPTTVQYFNDVFNSPFQLETKTAADLATELFANAYCNISSDIKRTLRPRPVAPEAESEN